MQPATAPTATARASIGSDGTWSEASGGHDHEHEHAETHWSYYSGHFTYGIASGNENGGENTTYEYDMTCNDSGVSGSESNEEDGHDHYDYSGDAPTVAYPGTEHLDGGYDSSYYYSSSEDFSSGSVTGSGWSTENGHEDHSISEDIPDIRAYGAPPIGWFHNTCSYHHDFNDSTSASIGPDGNWTESGSGSTHNNYGYSSDYNASNSFSYWYFGPPETCSDSASVSVHFNASDSASYTERQRHMVEDLG